jgi:hypothetical protein
MTSEERIAEFTVIEAGWVWDNMPEDMRKDWIADARSLLTFLRDELGFVQKDEDQIPPLIEHYSGSWQAIANGAYHKAGFVRVKSILPAQE